MRRAANLDRNHKQVVLYFEVQGSPRTKKTSQRIVQIRPKNGGRSFTKILPSAAHAEWFKLAMQQAPGIRSELACAGLELPLEGWLAVEAVVYRERDTGDLLGYLQALADWLQEPKANEHGKTIRDGAGIIHDDVQIRSWDGSRLMKDAACPRIEVSISVMAARPVERDLF